jgi:hypothetical protein
MAIRKFVAVLAVVVFAANHSPAYSQVTPVEPFHPVLPPTPDVAMSSAELPSATANITATPIPEMATITPQMEASFESGATILAGTHVLDISKESVPGTLSFAGNLVNYGNLVIYSSDHAISTAQLTSAGSIFNSVGGTITTVIPPDILATLVNPVAGLSLSLSAADVIANSGTISSASNLALTANAVINALPAGSTANSPVIQAMNSINITTGVNGIANAGSIAALHQNLNINTLVPMNVIINNVGGTLSALNGSMNVRDELFASKLNTYLLGGDVLSKATRIFSGNGLIDINVERLSGALTIRSGDGIVKADSTLQIANVVFTGDPVVQGQDIRFSVDPDSDEGLCSGSGFGLHGMNATIDDDVEKIELDALEIRLDGKADLGRLPISSARTFTIRAEGDITTNDVTAASHIVLVSNNGNITTENLTAGGVVVLSAGKQVSTKSIDISQGSLNINVNRSGSSSAFSIGSGGDVESVRLSGSVGTFGFIKNDGDITITSPDAISFGTPGATLLIDAGSGTLTLPSGTLSVNGEFPQFYFKADTIKADGSTLQTQGVDDAIVLAANVIDKAGALTLNANRGQIRLLSHDGLDLRVADEQDGFGLVRTIQQAQSALSIEGTGTLSATADGAGSLTQFILVSASDLSFSGGKISLQANGMSNEPGGNIFLSGSTINNSSEGISLSSNGAEAGRGGNITIINETGDLSLDNKYSLSAKSGNIFLQANQNLTITNVPTELSAGSSGPGGNFSAVAVNGKLTVQGSVHSAGVGSESGGAIFLKGNSIDASGVTLSAPGGNSGTGGNITVFANSDKLTINNSISAAGAGTGNGGNVFLRADSFEFGTTSIDANGGDSGAGGTIFVTAATGDVSSAGTTSISSTGGLFGGHITLFAGAGNVAMSGSLNASGTGQSGQARNISITAGDSKAVSLPVTVVADGIGNGGGGNVSIVGGTVVSNGSTISTNGGASGTGGNIVVTSTGSDINLANNTTITSKGGKAGGTATLFSSSGALTFGGTIDASGTGDNSKGGTISVTSAADKSVAITGSLLADGKGTEDGGNMVLGGGAVQISGALLRANASGAGFGGNIGLIVTGQDGITIGDQTQILTSGTTQDKIGTVTLRAIGHPIVVEGNAVMSGWMLAEGSLVSVGSTAQDTILSVRSIISSTDNTSLTLTNTGTRIDIFSSSGAAIISAGDVVLQADSMNVGILNGANSGSIRNGFVLAADNVSVVTNAGSNGAIRIGADVSVNDESGTISMTAHGDGDIVSISGRLMGHSIILSTVNGSMSGEGSNLDIAIWSDQVIAHSAENAPNSVIAIRQEAPASGISRTLNVNGLFSTSFTGLIGHGDLNINSEIRGGIAGLDLQTTSGDIKIGASITALAQITIFAGTNDAAAIVQTQPLALITGRSLRVAARDGEIGSPSQPLIFVGTGEEFSSVGASPVLPTQDCYINNLGSTPIRIGQTEVSGNFWLTTSGSISQDAGIGLTAKNVQLVSTGGGNIGTSARQSIQVSVDSMQLLTSGAGAVFVRNQESPNGGFGSGPLRLQPSTSGGPFHLRTQNGLEIAGVRSNGVVTLITDNNVLNVLVLAEVTGSPTVNLQVANVSSTSRIQLDPLSKITATSAATAAAVHIYIGDVPGTGFSPVEWTNVSFTRSGSGQILFGGSGIAASGPTNFINAIGGFVILQPATRPASDFVLGGGVEITAKSDIPLIIPRGTGLPPGHGGTAPGTSAPPPGKTNAPGQTNTLPPGQNNSGAPGQTGGSPGLQLPPPGQNGNTSPSQGIPIPQGQVKRGVKSSRLPGAPGLEEWEQQSYLPVGFISTLLFKGSGPCLVKEELENGTLYYLDESVPSASYCSKLVVVDAGTVVVRARRKMFLSIGQTCVALDPNTTIWLSKTHETLIVRCLYEDHANAVQIADETWNGKLSAGQQIRIGEAADKVRVPERSVIHYRLHKCIDIATSEFSISSMLTSDPILSLLRFSPTQSERASIKRMIKLAACLQLATGSHGPFNGANK